MGNMKSIKHIFTVYFALFFVIAFLMIQCKNPDKSKKEDKEKTSIIGKTTQREQPKLVYDANGNITERHASSYRSDNTIRSKDNFYYKYDKHNNLVEEIKESSSPEGVLVYKNVNSYKYNDLNQKIEQKFSSYDANGMLQQNARNTFRYNEKGELVEQKTYHENETVKSIIYTERNGDGSLKSEEYIYFDPNGIKTSHKKYHYSKYGLESTEDLIMK
jgi:uncharacterized protein (UPF0297 family)